MPRFYPFHFFLFSFSFPSFLSPTLSSIFLYSMHLLLLLNPLYSLLMIVSLSLLSSCYPCFVRLSRSDALCISVYSSPIAEAHIYRRTLTLSLDNLPQLFHILHLLLFWPPFLTSSLSLSLCTPLYLSRCYQRRWDHLLLSNIEERSWRWWEELVMMMTWQNPI